MSLTTEQIKELLELDSLPKQFPRIKQEGPLRFVDETMSCVSRGCGSPTWCKVKGIPMCLMHALRELNQMLINLGIEN